MGRTLHFSIFGPVNDEPIPYERRRRIKDAQGEMNNLFTWTCKDIRLQFFERSQIVYGPLPPSVWKDRWGEGTIQVIKDEWNAALVVSFLTWVSTQLRPGWFIRVYDEGDFIVG